MVPGNNVSGSGSLPSPATRSNGGGALYDGASQNSTDHAAAVEADLTMHHRIDDDVVPYEADADDEMVVDTPLPEHSSQGK